MPALEMAQETGKLVSWLKQEGESVTKGEPLLEIETDKAVVEVEAAADGVLAGVTGEVGTDIPVGHVIAWILKPGEQVPESAIVTTSVADSVIESAKPAEAIVSQSQPESGRVSPRARRLAKEAGIDLSAVKGSGDGGEILASDIQALVDSTANQTAPATVVAPHYETLSSIGRLMAERTTQSWTSVPHFFLQRDLDASGLNVARAKFGPEVEHEHGIKLTHTDILIALVGRTLAKHPRVNASWIDNGIRLNPEVNVAIAIAVTDGVISAVVLGADKAKLGEIAKQRHGLAERAKTGRLRPADLSGGTFTISNLGMFHIDSFNAIITPPQAAILAVGQIADRVVPIGGAIGIRPMLSLTLSSDHRVLDGAKSAVFMEDLASALRDPERCLE